MLLTRSPLSPKNASASWIPFDLHVLSTPPAFILSQDQTLQQKPKTKPTKNSRQKNDPTKKARPKWFKPENNPAKTNTNNQKTKRSKIISIKKTKNRKNQNTQPNSQAPQSIPHKQNKKTHYREHKQPNHKPTKLAGQDSSRAKNNRRKTRFPPASSLSNEYKVTAPTSTGQTRLGKSKRHHNSSDFHRFSHYGVERVADF